jgi:bifunctional NMN adenylyltransferase/nudix hydrolase
MSNFKYKHGLCVMRAQPFHIGHKKLIDFMLKDCALVTVILGSVQESGSKRNPYDYQTRLQMINNVYQKDKNFNRLQIYGVPDINRPGEWGGYILRCVKEKFPQAPEPDVYYAGSTEDAFCFQSCCRYVEIVDRNDPSFPFVSGTMVRDMISLGDKRWKDFIPSENHKMMTELIKNKF